MNRQNLMKLKDIVLRNRARNLDEVHQFFEASPERAEFLRRLAVPEPLDGLSELAAFVDIDVPDEVERGDVLDGEFGWLHTALYGTDRFGTDSGLSGQDIAAALDEKIKDLPPA